MLWKCFVDKIIINGNGFLFLWYNVCLLCDLMYVLDWNKVGGLLWRKNVFLVNIFVSICFIFFLFFVKIVNKNLW